MCHKRVENGVNLFKKKKSSLCITYKLSYDRNGSRVDALRRRPYRVVKHHFIIVDSILELFSDSRTVCYIVHTRPLDYLKLNWIEFFFFFTNRYCWLELRHIVNIMWVYNVRVYRFARAHITRLIHEVYIIVLKVK